MRRGEGHFALAVARRHGDELSGLHELVEYVVDDARGQSEPCADHVGGRCTALFAEVPHHGEHHGQQDLTPLVVAYQQRFALLAEAGDVLVGERQLAAEQQDLP